MSFTETHVTIGGNKTKLLRGGDGPPLLYLHSAGGETMWMPFHEELAKHFELFAPAHPGFDSSEGLEAIDSIEDLVFHYLDFFDEMKLDRVPVMGLSLGGWIAAEFATRYPQRLEKLVLLDAAGLFVEGHPMAPLYEYARNPEKLRKLVFADPDSPIAKMLIQHPDDMPDELLTLQLKAAESAARVAWNPYFHNRKLVGRLRRITTPTLVVWGDCDGLIPVEHGKVYAENIPDAKLVVLENCGHMPNFECLDAFLEHTLGFLKG